MEVVAAEDRLQAAIPDLNEMIDGGLITLERACVIMYRSHDAKDDERWEQRIDGLRPADHDAT